MYNKIFTKILDSSIWLESDSTRIVWLTMLASMNQDGFCQFASVGNLAHRAIVTRESAEEAVKVLESPDTDSSDPDNEGRRIQRVDGGWMVLNSSKYRDIVTSEEGRRKTRERVKKFREGQNVTLRNDSVTIGNVSVTQSEAVSEAEALKPPTPFLPAALPSEDREEINTYMAAQRVGEELGLYGQQVIGAIERAVKTLCRDLAIDAVDASQVLCDRWREYEASDLKFKFEIGAWLSQGIYKKPEKWTKAVDLKKPSLVATEAAMYSKDGRKYNVGNDD